MSVFAMLDEGSTTTLQDQQIAHDIGIQDPNQSLCVEWIKRVRKDDVTSQIVSITISSMSSKARRYALKAVHTLEGLNLSSDNISLCGLFTKKILAAQGI